MKQILIIDDVFDPPIYKDELVKEVKKCLKL